MIQLFVVTDPFQAVVLAAALDSGTLDPDETSAGAAERVLVTASTAAVPEAAPALPAHPGLDAVARRFDRVVDLDAVVAPLRPVDLAPRDLELPLWERLLRDRWALGDAPLELFVEPPYAGTGLALARIFATARVSVHAGRLLTYGPTRRRVPADVAARLGVLVHPELVAGVPALLLGDLQVPTAAVGADAVRAVVAEVAAAVPAPHDPRPRPFALVLGPDGAHAADDDAGAARTAAQAELRASLETVRAHGVRHVVLRPGDARVPTGAVLAVARELGMSIGLADRDELVEAVAVREQPDLLVGCTPTLVTTGALVDGATVAVGAAERLDELAPFQTSARIPWTILDALHSPDAPAAPLPHLVKTVAHCMQPGRTPDLRPVAESFLASQPREAWRRYVRVLRAERVGLLAPRVPAHPEVRGLALVESPLQLLGAYEAFCRGLLGTRCDILVRPGPGMARTADALRTELPPGLNLALAAGGDGTPRPDVEILAVGDALSGQIQARLVARRLPPRVLLLDDGIASIAALGVIADGRGPLVRGHVPAPLRRRLLGRAATRTLARLAREGRLVTLTALPLPDGLEARLTSAGIDVQRHTFEHLRGLRGSSPAMPRERLVLLGSALPADGLVDEAAYVEWVAAQAASEPVRYLPHRRETPEVLDRLRRLPGIVVDSAGLPAELLLRDLRAPRAGDIGPALRVRSLPSTALLTLHPVLSPRGVRIEPVAVPPHWWTSSATPELRAHLERSVPAVEDGAAVRVVERSDRR